MLVFSDANDVMSESQAEQIARTVATGTLTSKDLKKKRSDPNYIYYDFEFESSTRETEVKVHAVTGKILSVKHEGHDKVDSSSVSISESRARSIATQAVAGTIQSIELENEDGNTVYEVDMSYNGRSVELEINANSGEVLEIGYAEGSAPSNFAAGGISKDEAIQIAEAKVSSSFDLEEVEAGYYHSTKVWEVEFEDGNEEVEVIIDVETGEILKTEYEDEDDEDDDDD